MKESHILLVLMFTVLLALASYRVTYALFSDSASSASNTFAAASTFPTTTSTPTPTPTGIADHLVISEVQTNGATANTDFVELYNPTNSVVDLNGWQIQTRNSAGTTSSMVLIGSGETILAHGYFLWANNQNGFAASVGADVANGNNISPNNSVALENPSDVIIDQLGWGTGGGSQYFETSLFANNPDTNQSLERKALSTSDATSMMSGADVNKGNGFDSNNNPNDFVLRTVSQPQNSGSATETP